MAAGKRRSEDGETKANYRQRLKFEEMLRKHDAAGSRAKKSMPLNKKKLAQAVQS